MADGRLQGTENEKVWVDEGIFLVLLSGALQYYVSRPHANCSTALRSSLAEMLPRLPMLAKEAVTKDLSELLESHEDGRNRDREAWIELLRKTRMEVDGS